jgi:hypothetical protein
LVIGDVQDADDTGQAGPQQRFDTLADGHFGQAAALASAVEAEADPPVLRADQDSAAAVGRDGRVDFAVDDAAGLFGQGRGSFWRCRVAG